MKAWVEKNARPRERLKQIYPNAGRSAILTRAELRLGDRTCDRPESPPVSIHGGVTIFLGSVKLIEAPLFLALRPSGRRSAEARPDGSIPTISGGGDGRRGVCFGWGCKSRHSQAFELLLHAKLDPPKRRGFPLWGWQNRGAGEHGGWTRSPPGVKCDCIKSPKSRPPPCARRMRTGS
jgi:hypothetical protein